MQVATMGGTATGALLWGQVATWSSVSVAVAASAIAIDQLARAEVTHVTAERHVSPLLPPWVWTLASSLLLGAHWIARRRGGLA